MLRQYVDRGMDGWIDIWMDGWRETDRETDTQIFCGLILSSVPGRDIEYLFGRV